MIKKRKGKKRRFVRLPGYIFICISVIQADHLLVVCKAGKTLETGTRTWLTSLRYISRMLHNKQSRYDAKYLSDIRNSADTYLYENKELAYIPCTYSLQLTVEKRLPTPNTFNP